MDMDNGQSSQVRDFLPKFHFLACLVKKMEPMAVTIDWNAVTKIRTIYLIQSFRLKVLTCKQLLLWLYTGKAIGIFTHGIEASTEDAINLVMLEYLVLLPIGDVPLLMTTTEDESGKENC